MQDANEQAVTWPERQGQCAVITRSKNPISMNESFKSAKKDVITILTAGECIVYRRGRKRDNGLFFLEEHLRFTSCKKLSDKSFNPYTAGKNEKGNKWFIDMIDLNEAEKILFASATEGYTGLYEAIWELNTLYPKETLGEKYKAAGHAIRALLDRKLITLFKASSYFGTGGTPTYSEVVFQDLDNILNNPVSWYPEYGNVTFVFELKKNEE